MRKDYFIYLEQGDLYLFATREDNIPPNKVAARVPLTEDAYKSLMNLSWYDYQDMLSFYFENGQKLVTA